MGPRFVRPSEEARLAAARAALGGPSPHLGPTWFRGAAAALQRERARAPDHPAHVDRALVGAWASVVVDLVRPAGIVDLSPWAHRHVRSFGRALAAEGGGHCVLHDGVAPRLVAAVRRLAADLPGLSVSGRLAPDGPCGPLAPGARGAEGRDARLVLSEPGGPDGADAVTVARHLHAVARGLQPGDAVVLVVETGRDPAALLASCGGRDAEAVHRAALAELVGALGGTVDPTAFALEARWCAPRRCVETRLVPAGPVRVALPHGVLTLAAPIRTGRVGAWTRGALRRLAAACGLSLGAWLPDADERRALVLLHHRGGCGVRARRL